MKRKICIVTAVAAIFVLFAASTVFASGAGMKSIKAYFGDIKIYVNDALQESAQQPFIYNDVTYVPLRLIGTAIGASVAWDSAQKAVIITTKSSGESQTMNQKIAELESQLSQKESQIAQLSQQNTYLSTRVADLEASLVEKEDEDASDPAEELEDYLYDEYSKWKSMEFDYNVDGDEDDLELTIGIDLSDYKSRWNSTDQDDIEDWLNDIYDYVEDEYPDADFSGEIEDTDEDETLVTFKSKSSSSNLSVDFEYSDLDFDELEDDLNDIYGDNLDDYNDDFGDMTADITVDGDEDDEEIYVEIEIDTSNYGDEWENVRETDDAEEWIEDIVEYVLDYYDDYDISGEVVNEDGDTMASFDVSSSGNVTFDWDYSY